MVKEKERSYIKKRDRKEDLVGDTWIRELKEGEK